MSNKTTEALSRAEMVIMEARAWVPLQNLDPDHHRYDRRAVTFVDRCNEALIAIRAVTVSVAVNHPNGDGTCADYVSDPFQKEQAVEPNV